MSDRLAELMTKTFYALLELADLEQESKPPKKVDPSGEKKEEKSEIPPADSGKVIVPPGLHYNIQIHLPATKDVEVYNAIFKSIKEHLLD